MKIFVAGAGGVVGRRLLPLLISAGHQVVGMTRGGVRKAAIQSLGATAVVADAFDRSAVFSTVIPERPDAMIIQFTNLGMGDSHVEDYARLRIEGTRNLVDAAVSVGARRIVAQSISQVYAPGRGKATEEDKLDLGASGTRRRLAESINTLEQTVLEVEFGVVLRYGTIYGPGTTLAKDGEFAEKVRREKVYATNEMTSFLHVDDAAQAALLALDWPRGIVNVVDDDPSPASIWLPIYAASIGANPPETKNETGLNTRGASNDKARYRLGWQPIHPTWRTALLQELI